jgi:hypothetical protein
MKENFRFFPEKGIAYCGLACCVCSENESCPGCRMDGCKNKADCRSYRCCVQKGLSGCWECSSFPCDNPMLQKIRVRVFARYIGIYGEENLISCLGKNAEAGIQYHYEGQLIGDYDRLETEEAIFDLIRYGR